jgi:hypothetical protein
MSTAVLTVRRGVDLVEPALLDRLVRRNALDHAELTDDMPERIADQALAFLAACAVATEPLGPSDAVDIGWHTFILYTREYAAFCDRVAGRFIHHLPDDSGSDDAGPDDDQHRVPLARAVTAIRVAGYAVDGDLWGIDATTGKCTQCHAGCEDSPKS